MRLQNRFLNVFCIPTAAPSLNCEYGVYNREEADVSDDGWELITSLDMLNDNIDDVIDFYNTNGGISVIDLPFSLSGSCLICFDDSNTLNLVEIGGYNDQLGFATVSNGAYTCSVHSGTDTKD